MNTYLDFTQVMNKSTQVQGKNNNNSAIYTMYLK